MSSSAVVVEHRTEPQVGVDVRYIVKVSSQDGRSRKVATTHIAFLEGETEAEYNIRYQNELDAAIQQTITELGG